MLKSVVLGSVAAVAVAGVAIAGDLPAKGAASAAPIAKKSFSWSGAYFGGNVGYTMAKRAGNAADCDRIQNISDVDGVLRYANICDAVDNGEIIDTGVLDLDGDYIDWAGTYANDPGYIQDNEAKSGWNFGGQFGMLHQSANDVVVGLEADVMKFSGVKATSEDAFSYWHSQGNNWEGDNFINSESSLDWMMTLRGRLGLAVGDQGKLLPYITGGAALAVVSSSMTTDQYYDGPGWCDSCTFGQPTGNNSFLQAGLVGGAGVEYAITDNISFGVEYLYTKLYGQQNRSVEFEGDSGRSFEVSHTVGFDDMQTVSAKLNFHF